MAAKFVSIQGVSLRLSNIKSFGIKQEERAPEPVPNFEELLHGKQTGVHPVDKPKSDDLLGLGLSVASFAWDIGRSLMGAPVVAAEKPKPRPAQPPLRYYFFVSTYQDYHCFYGDKAQLEGYQKILEDAFA